MLLLLILACQSLDVLGGQEGLYCPETQRRRCPSYFILSFPGMFPPFLAAFSVQPEDEDSLRRGGHQGSTAGGDRGGPPAPPHTHTPRKHRTAASPAALRPVSGARCIRSWGWTAGRRRVHRQERAEPGLRCWRGRTTDGWQTPQGPGTPSPARLPPPASHPRLLTCGKNRRHRRAQQP